MIDIEEITNAIEELESKDLTYDICQKLANLYTIRHYYENDVVTKEYNDILPSYQKFCEVKKMYQLSEVSENSVYKQLKLLCNEISEFLRTLYNNTDTQYEHDIIEETLKTII